MMSVSNKSITAEITYDEMNIISALLSERITEMKKKLSKTTDNHKYLQIHQLHAKTCAMLDLIDAENNKRIEQEKQEKENVIRSIDIENVEFSLKTGC